jgi:hypothetical protein
MNKIIHNMKLYISKSFTLIGLSLFFISISFMSCDKNESKMYEQLTPQALYQTSWRGIGHCKAWAKEDLNIGVLFLDSQKGKVNWEGVNEKDFSYIIEGKFITFNGSALYLSGSPWVIKSYTQKHITLIQHEQSPDPDQIAIIELDRVN